MPFTPDTVLYLCYVPIDSTQQNQLKFTSTALQESYFATTIKHTFDNVTYQRKDGPPHAAVAAHIDTLWDVNYCMYQNHNFGTKWFYAFIEKMEWVSDGCTNVYIKTDVYQTWMMDCTLLSSFVEREMILVDDVGANLVDEGLETGEYVKVAETALTELDDLAIVVVTTESEEGVPTTGGIYSGIYSGLAYYAFFGAGKVGDCNGFIGSFTTAGKALAIKAIFMVPSCALPDEALSGYALPADFVSGTVNTKAITYSTTALGTYTPKNKKLLTYPYNFLHVSNLSSQSADYKFEYLESFSGTFNFAFKTSVCPGAKTMLIPVSGYKRPGSDLNANTEEALEIGNYPICAWVTGAWENWIAQNALTVAAGAGSSMMTIGAGLMVGNPMAIGGGVVGVMDKMGEIYKHAREPDQAHGNINGSTVQVAWGLQHFMFWQMCVNVQFATRLDQFFDMFGYKTNLVKVPNVATRTYWNYVKTIDVNILGDIPAEDMVQLKQVYDKGVTLWHSPGNVGNYALDNH